MAAPIALLGGPAVWTKISSGVGGSEQQPELLRTSDGKLHVAWVEGQDTSRRLVTCGDADRLWCARGELNPHTLSGTGT
jgi:hypothetical protein